MRSCFTVVSRFIGTAFTASLTSVAFAQALYVTEDRTVTNGNPVNGTYSIVYVGINSNFVAFPGVHADITGGTVTEAVQARNGSFVELLGATVNSITGYDTSTINVRAGTISRPFSSFSNYGLAGFGTSILNLYGGTITGNAAEVSEQATLNIYGTGLTAEAFATGVHGNYNGTFYRVNGTLSDGTTLQNFTLFDADTGSSNPGRNFNFVTVPEPSTAAHLLTVGAGFWLYRRVRSSYNKDA